MNIFKYNEQTDNIEFDDLKVRVGGSEVEIKSSTNEILYNGIPIGSQSGGVGKLSIVGDPNEFAHTIEVPLRRFFYDINSVPTGGTQDNFSLTVRVKTSTTYKFIMVAMGGMNVMNIQKIIFLVLSNVQKEVTTFGLLLSTWLPS